MQNTFSNDINLKLSTLLFFTNNVINKIFNRKKLYKTTLNKKLFKIITLFLTQLFMILINVKKNLANH